MMTEMYSIMIPVLEIYSLLVFKPLLSTLYVRMEEATSKLNILQRNREATFQKFCICICQIIKSFHDPS